jgi:tripartite ATP-independent transporter DctP family solute receptor
MSNCVKQLTANLFDEISFAPNLARLLLVALAGLMLWTKPCDAATTQLIFSHSGGPGSLYDVTAKEFARRLDAALPPDFAVVIQGGGTQLGDPVQVLEKLKRGEITFGIASTAVTTMSEIFGIFDLPFLIRNREQVRRITKVMLEPILQPEVHKYGFRILAIWENGFRHITNNVRPIRRPDDLKGLRIRVPEGAWRQKVFRALGAEPVTMPLREVYQGFKSGAIDGQENPLAQIKGGRFDEVQRFLALSDHSYTPAYVMVSEEHFAKLPPEVQEAIEKTAAEMQDWVYATAVKMESELLDQLGERMQTNQIDSKAFIDASRPLYRDFVQTVPGGAKLVGIVQELADENSASTP